MKKVKKSKITQGPWNVIGDIHVMLPDGSTKPTSVYAIEPTGRKDGESCVCAIVPNKADADLIAAAPDLLEALRETTKQLTIMAIIMMRFEGIVDYASDTAIESGRKAIDKALGGAS